MFEKIGQLKMVAPNGKQRLTDCANTEILFHVIQSIPSLKVNSLETTEGETRDTAAKFLLKIGMADFAVKLKTNVG